MGFFTKHHHTNVQGGSRIPKATGFLPFDSGAYGLMHRLHLRRGRAQVRSRIRSRKATVALLTSLMPSHWDLEVFAARVGAHRGKALSIVVCPMPLEMTGVWMATTRSDYVFVNSWAGPELTLTHVIQQIAHIALGHRASAIGGSPPTFRIPTGHDHWGVAETEDAEIVTAVLLGRIQWPTLNADLENTRV